MAIFETAPWQPGSSTFKRVFVTGATGTLGSNVLKRLACDPRYQVIAPVRDLHSQVVSDLRGSVQFIELELCDAVHTAQIFERANPEIILHCAATGLRPPSGSWFELMHFNVESTMRLFEMNCRIEHRTRFIYISSGLAYREQGRALREADPLGTLHPYGASKAAADAMLQAAAAGFKRDLTILRPFTFTGPHDGGKRLFPLILEAAQLGRALALTVGTQIRDFCSVDDIADAVLRVMEQKQENLIEIFNLGSGDSQSLRTIIEDIRMELELNVRLEFGKVPLPPYEPHHLVADVSHVREVLGWKPTTKLAYSIWQLAQEITPGLRLRKPERFREHV